MSAAVAAVLSLPISGCAAQAPPSAGPAASSSPTPGSSPAGPGPVSVQPTVPVPSTRPPNPTPRGGPTAGPSDEITGFWLLGAITIGSPGPCYRLQTDDGRLLTLFGQQLGKFTAGDRLRVLVKASDPEVQCGDDAMTVMDVKRAG